MRFAPLLLALLSISAAAQSWPTTDWEIRSEDGGALTGERAAGAEAYRQQLEAASVWLQSLGFPSPQVIRAGEEEAGPLGPYVGFMKSDTEGLGATYVNVREAREIETAEDVLDWAIELVVDFNSPPRRFYLSGNSGTWDPQSAPELLMSAGPTHELFHGVQAAYGGRSGAPAVGACQGTGQSLDWIWEGAASAVQIRWLERTLGTRHAHTYHDPSRATWARYFDHPLHKPRQPVRPTANNVSWICGYGTWYFWYSVGEMLAEEPGQEVAYLDHVFGGSHDWSDFGIANLDGGLREAAEAFGSSFRYDEGLFEVYPAFIAEYADSTAFYERTDQVYLRGRSEVKWRDGVIEPIAAKAFEVRIDVRDDLPADQPSRLRVTLDPQEHRDQMHLIEGQRVLQQPTGDVDPYQFVIPIRRDTTVLVRLANVAEDAAATVGTPYAIRFELGGFYGAPASGPYVAPDVDIPPGFSVMSGPPELVGCSGGAEGGSVFDLVTAAEATGDVRRKVDGAERMLDDMDEALEDGEFYFPGMTPAQRRGMQQAIESGAISEAELAQLRAAVNESQGRMDEVRQAGDEAQADLASEYRDRSTLMMTLVGRAGGETCQILVGATLRGEEGGAQQLSAQDREGHGPDDPMVVGISNVGWLVGSLEDMAERERNSDPFGVCMMTPREQQRVQESARYSQCPPVVCSAGSLTLEEASQGHAKGTLNVDLVRTTSTGQGCPRVERRQLVVGFNITSANAGQDAEMFRGMSDETLRAMGVSQEQIDALRQFDGGGMFE